MINLYLNVSSIFYLRDLEFTRWFLERSTRILDKVKMKLKKFASKILIQPAIWLFIVFVSMFTTVGYAQEVFPEINIQADQVVLWDQPPNLQRSSGLYSFKSSYDSTSSIIFESFELKSKSRIDEIKIYGTTYHDYLFMTEAADTLFFALYKNQDGYPGDGKFSSTYELAVSVHSSNLRFIDAEGEDITMLYLNFDNPEFTSLILDPGVYWFTVYFDNRFFNYSWFWAFGKKSDRSSIRIDPIGGFLPIEKATFQKVSDVLRNYNFAFRISGQVL